MTSISRSPGPLPDGIPLDWSSVLVQGAIDDLAGRLGIDRDDIVVIDARGVTWPDQSCGCPKPGMQYLQRLVDGALVVLAVGGRRYQYHGGDPLRLCENPKSQYLPDVGSGPRPTGEGRNRSS